MIRIYKETIICFVKVQSENMKMAWGIKLFIPAQQLEDESSKQGKVIFQMWRFYNFVNNVSIIEHCNNFIVSLWNPDNFRYLFRYSKFITLSMLKKEVGWNSIKNKLISE